MSDKPTLLLIDDDAANLRSYSLAFARQPYRLLTAGGGQEALDTLQRETVDVLLTDLKMPGVDGLDVLRGAMSLLAPPVCIVVTAFGTIESAVEAMRCGAFDYVTKPVNLQELRAKIEKALEVRALRVRNEQLEGLVSEKFKFEGVIGISDAMARVIDQSRKVAASNASVLIEGESGTGKELIARAVHFNSPRATGPFVPIHCAALPETLLESELFGHEKGAFTGAQQRRTGQFEAASGGTVFLDELGEIPLSMQVKLLRVLEQREIIRVGSTQPVPIDIRLVAATNKDLATEVREGRFREDLYYRLNVVRITLPPLRDRPEDIPHLVRHFLNVLARDNNRPVPKPNASVLERLAAYDWPGNIRELRNVLEQLIVFAPSGDIGLDDLPPQIREGAPGGSSSAATSSSRAPAMSEHPVTLAELEKQQIALALERNDGNRSRAAKELGISRRTLHRRLKEMGMDEGE